MSKESFRDWLLAELDRTAALQARIVEQAGFREGRSLVREWQARRLARTHRDLLESPRFHAAAEFFLEDLYGPKDFSRHIEDVRRIASLMTSVLPAPALAAVAHAVELNALTESLDGDMADALEDAQIDASAYGKAYRKVGHVEDRRRQIDLIALLGEGLEALTRQRFIGTALKMMRKPAELAGLGELQAFLERGFVAFGAMRGRAGEFVSTVVARERKVSEALFAGDDSPLRGPLA
jgi:hypothetical protein